MKIFNIKKLFVVFVCLILQLLCAKPCFALPSASDHTELWIYCLGGLNANPNIRNQLRQLSSLIDGGLKEEFVRNALERLEPTIAKNLPPPSTKFRLSIDGETHRRIFHWGLTNNPDYLEFSPNAEPLKTLFELRLNNLGDTITATEKSRLRRALYRIVGDEWRSRQKEFINITTNIFGSEIVSQCSVIPPIAVVLYEIHILADYRDRRIGDLGGGLGNIEKGFEHHILNELIQNGLQQFPKNRNLDELIKNLKQAYHRSPAISAKEVSERMDKMSEEFRRLMAKSTGNSEDSIKRRASHLLLILVEQLPKVLVESYPSAMDAIGIDISSFESSRKRFFGINNYLW